MGVPSPLAQSLVPHPSVHTVSVPRRMQMKQQSEEVPLEDEEPVKS